MNNASASVTTSNRQLKVYKTVYGRFWHHEDPRPPAKQLSADRLWPPARTLAPAAGSRDGHGSY